MAEYGKTVTIITIVPSPIDIRCSKLIDFSKLVQHTKSTFIIIGLRRGFGSAMISIGSL